MRSRTQAKVFTISFPDTHLTIEEVWPDGDAPENPSAEDVAEVMRRNGGFRGVLSDWNIIDSLEVDGITVR